MPRGFLLDERRGVRAEGRVDRDAKGFDIEPRRRFQPLPDSLTVATRRTIEAAKRATTTRTRTPPPPPPETQQTRPPGPIPENPAPPLPSEAPEEDPMTFIPFGGSGPTSPTLGGFTPGGGFLPTGGGGIDIGDSLQGALGGLIRRGAEELGDRLFGGSGSEAPSGNTPIPGGAFAPTGGSGPCPGVGSIRIPGTNQCVNIGDLGPGGAPATTPRQSSPGEFTPVAGFYGAGFLPVVEERMHRTCPPGFVLGKDGVCYDSLAKSKRKWNPGRKPLLTGGEMAAIAKAKRAAGRLKRAKKGLKKSARELEKAC